MSVEQVFVMTVQLVIVVDSSELLERLVRKGPLNTPQFTGIVPSHMQFDIFKAKFHYAIRSQTGPKLVADMQRPASDLSATRIA